MKEEIDEEVERKEKDSETTHLEMTCLTSYLRHLDFASHLIKLKKRRKERK